MLNLERLSLSRKPFPVLLHPRDGGQEAVTAALGVESTGRLQSAPLSVCCPGSRPALMQLSNLQ